MLKDLNLIEMKLFTELAYNFTLKSFVQIFGESIIVYKLQEYYSNLHVV